MGISHSEAYAAAGVDIEAGYQGVKMMNRYVQRTLTADVISDLGGFGGLFSLDLHGLEKPVLVSGTDGVGTKLKIAFLMDKHDTVGIDCVAMCANDVACAGAKPLFFLDYVAVGKNVPERVAQIVAGVAEGCVQAGCALIGGDTAEMPGFYPKEEYDLAGFCVGMADKAKLIDGAQMKAGDALIGVSSSGVHSNGFSLVRKVFNITPERLNLYMYEFGKTLGEELLTPTRIYVKSLLALMEQVEVHGVSHITGGGFYENIPRMLPDYLRAAIEKAKVPVRPIFKVIQSEGISEHDMYNTFNMGVGLCVAVAADQADEAVRILKENGEEACILGEVREGEKGIDLC